MDTLLVRVSAHHGMYGGVWYLQLQLEARSRYVDVRVRVRSTYGGACQGCGVEGREE